MWVKKYGGCKFIKAGSTWVTGPVYYSIAWLDGVYVRLLIKEVGGKSVSCSRFMRQDGRPVYPGQSAEFFGRVKASQKIKHRG